VTFIETLRTRNWPIIVMIASVVLLLVVIGIALVQNARPANLQEAQQDLKLQQEVIDQLQKENAQLRQQSNDLRQRAIAYSENASKLTIISEYCKQACPSAFISGQEIADPATRISISDILNQQNGVFITIPGVREGVIAATNSMDPVMDTNNIVLQITPSDPAQIETGDIIVYSLGSDRIIHRVSDTGHDIGGWYAITKGDNNRRADPERVRFDQVLGVVVGIIY
jgi:signal peptidase I